MPLNRSQFIYTGPDHKHNWFYNKYYYGGNNHRYYTFQVALNLLLQTTKDPVIIETGCQRQLDDIGAGMSTSIFAEFISRYGGKLISVDIEETHLLRAANYISRWNNIDVELVLSDSISFLQQYEGTCDLLYLDSLDYPIGTNAGDVSMQNMAQQHCLKEFMAAEKWIKDTTIILADDNSLPAGGKPLLLKEHLVHNNWCCLMDLQQTLWVKQ